MRRVTRSLWIANFQCWTFPEVAILGANQKERSLWGQEWVCEGGGGDDKWQGSCWCYFMLQGVLPVNECKAKVTLILTDGGFCVLDLHCTYLYLFNPLLLLWDIRYQQSLPIHAYFVQHVVHQPMWVLLHWTQPWQVVFGWPDFLFPGGVQFIRHYVENTSLIHSKYMAGPAIRFVCVWFVSKWCYYGPSS